MKRTMAGLLAACWLLGGCALWEGDDGGEGRADRAQAAAQQGDDASQACGARRLDELVGQTMTQSVKEQIVDQSQAQQYRVLRPGMMRTMDHNPQRLNITLDDSGAITDFSCG